MGHPAYEARREAERAQAEKDRASAEAAEAAFVALTDFMAGKAWLAVMPEGNGGFAIRLVRDHAPAA